MLSFACLSFCVLPLVFVISFACLLALFSLSLHVHAWSKGVTSKMQAKKGKNASKKTQAQRGQCLVDRRFSLPEGFLSLSLLAFFFRTMYLD